MAVLLSALDNVLAQLDAAGASPSKNGQGYKAHCQAHDDEHPSLYVKQGDGGRVLITCRAGCTHAAVLKAHGLKSSDLKSTNGTKPLARLKTSPAGPADPLPSDARMAEWRANLKTTEVLRSFKWKASTLRGLRIGWDGSRFTIPVRSADDELVNVLRYALVRYERQTKMFALKGRPRDLFPAPETVSGDALLLVEGEPDAIAGQCAGLPAVAVPGINGWKPEWCDRFIGRAVSIVFDCDQPGRKAAAKIADELAALDIEVRVVDLAPERSDGYDLKELLRVAESPSAARRLVQRRIAAAKIWEPRNGVQIIRLSDVQTERVTYLRAGVPLGMVTMLAGHPGLGKTLWTQNLAAEVSRGDLLDKAAHVVLISGEDSLGVIRGRLLAAEADLTRVVSLRLKRDGEEVGIVIPDDLPTVERRIEQVGARLVVIDPVNAFLSTTVDYFKDPAVRSVLGPLVRMAARLNIAVLIVTHLTKGQTSEALHRVGGSVGYGAAVRSALLWDRDPDDEDGEQGSRRVLVHVKSNVGPLERSLIYEVVPATVEGDISTARLEEVGESDLGANELLARNGSRLGSGDKPRERVAGALRLVLGDGEPHERAAVIAEVVDLTGASERTIKRAASELDVVSERSGYPAKATWTAPDSWAKPSGPTKRGQLAQLRKALQKRLFGRSDRLSWASPSLWPNWTGTGASPTDSRRATRATDEGLQDLRSPLLRALSSMLSSCSKLCLAARCVDQGDRSVRSGSAVPRIDNDVASDARSGDDRQAGCRCLRLRRALQGSPRSHRDCRPDTARAQPKSSALPDTKARAKDAVYDKQRSRLKLKK